MNKSLALAIAGIIAFVWSALGLPLHSKPQENEATVKVAASADLASLARDTANALRAEAPHGPEAHLGLLDVTVTEEVVEAKFFVDSVAAPLFEGGGAARLASAISVDMCRSQLGRRFLDGMVVHSVYTDSKQNVLADFTIDSFTCIHILK